MAKNLPDFRKGMQQSDMVASEMNSMSEEAAALASLTVAPPLRLQRGHKSLALSIDPALIPSPQPEKTVVITDIRTHTLLVKAVRYKKVPPIQCIGEEPAAGCGIEVIDQVFTAYPDFGTKPADYTGMKYTAPVSATTQYAKCSLEHGVWIVKMAGGGAGGAPVPVKILIADPANPDVLKVQPLKWVTDDDGNDNLVNDGARVTVKPWPDRTNADYAAFIYKPDVFAMFNLGGKLCVMHEIRFLQQEPPEGVVWAGCP